MYLQSASISTVALALCQKSSAEIWVVGRESVYLQRITQCCLTIGPLATESALYGLEIKQLLMVRLSLKTKYYEKVDYLCDADVLVLWG